MILAVLISGTSLFQYNIKVLRSTYIFVQILYIWTDAFLLLYNNLIASYSSLYFESIVSSCTLRLLITQKGQHKTANSLCRCSPGLPEWILINILLLHSPGNGSGSSLYQKITLTRSKKCGHHAYGATTRKLWTGLIVTRNTSSLQ